MTPSDHDLLRQYACEGSQAAFAELVRRHLDLVYAAARRQVRSLALAEEIAQSVFLDLSRHAARMKPATPLVAWLHVVTRHTAIDAIRRESRRQAREKAASEIAAMKPSPSVWTEMEPLLDEALEKLGETDRAAILLRYFQNKSLREIGEALGASEAAAQKRVTRAVDQLRLIFAKRGIAIGATGLATELSAHAIQIAPAALGASISTTTLTGTVALLKTTEALAMTTLQKSLLATSLAVLIGSGLYEAREVSRQRAAISTEQQRLVALEAETGSLQQQREAAARRTTAADREIDALLAKANAGAAADDHGVGTIMEKWLSRLDRLKQIREQRPDLTIPELQLLGEQDWFRVARYAKFETDAQIRDLFAELRRQAENRFAIKLMHALNAYLKANAGMLPADSTPLASFFDPPVDPAMLQRYQMQHTGKYDDLPRAEQGFLIAARVPVDIERDAFWQIGRNDFSAPNALGYDVKEARKNFTSAHPGEKATEAAQLLPYLKWPADPASVQKILSPAPDGSR